MVSSKVDNRSASLRIRAMHLAFGLAITSLTLAAPLSAEVYYFTNLQASSSVPQSAFGLSSADVDVNGDNLPELIVGAPFTAAGAIAEAGLIQIKPTTGAPFPSSFNAYTLQGSTSERLGWQVKKFADLNGDGRAEVAVSSPKFASSAGKVQIFSLPDPNSTSSVFQSLCGSIQMPSPGANDDFGSSIAVLGAASSSALLVVGAPRHDGLATNSGGVFVYSVSRSGSTCSVGSAVTIAPSSDPGAKCGEAVASLGDVNGDFKDDFIFGCPFEGTPDKGRVHVHSGDAALGFPLLYSIDSPALTQGGAAQSATEFGHAVSTAGDVNRDGSRDILVGAPGVDNTRTASVVVNSGAAYLFDGSNGSPITEFHFDEAGANYGSSVTASGDLDFSGFGLPVYHDKLALAVGGRQANGGADNGMVRVFSGLFTPPNGAQFIQVSALQSHSSFPSLFGVSMDTTEASLIAGFHFPGFLVSSTAQSQPTGIPRIEAYQIPENPVPMMNYGFGGRLLLRPGTGCDGSPIGQGGTGVGTFNIFLANWPQVNSNCQAFSQTPDCHFVIKASGLAPNSEITCEVGKANAVHIPMNPGINNCTDPIDENQPPGELAGVFTIPVNSVGTLATATMPGFDTGLIFNNTNQQNIVHLQCYESKSATGSAISPADAARSKQLSIAVSG